MTLDTNRNVADKLDEVARLLGEQEANPFRVRAYRRAAATLRAIPRPVEEIFSEGGLEALEALPDIGESLGRAIAQILVTGRLQMLERLRGESEPLALLRTVPGIGAVLAHRIHDHLGIETLEELELAAHDGRLETISGFGQKRLTGIRDSLAHRLARVRRPPPRGDTPAPRVAELLDVDREYRQEAEAERLPRIAPRRFNPRKQAWLPILHTRRGDRSYTVLYSNTPRAHELGKTHDWAIMYVDGRGVERQYTVITAEFGPLQGRRIVRGREAECRALYESPEPDEDVRPPTPAREPARALAREPL